MPYIVGQTYIWQNQIGEMAHLNGTECTVLGPPEDFWCVIKHGWFSGQLVDTPTGSDTEYFAEAGDLREKRPPQGEQSVLDLFKQPELEPA